MYDRHIAYTVTDEDLGVSFDVNDHSELRGIFDLMYPPDTRHWFNSNVLDFLSSIPGMFLWTAAGRDSLDKMGLVIEPADDESKGVLIGESDGLLGDMLSDDLRARMKAVKEEHFLPEYGTWKNRDYYQSDAFAQRCWKNPPGGIRLFGEDEKLLRAGLKAIGGSVYDGALLDYFITMLDEADLVRFPANLETLKKQFEQQHGRAASIDEQDELARRASELAQRSVLEDYVNAPVRDWHEQLAIRCEEAGYPIP